MAEFVLLINHQFIRIEDKPARPEHIPHKSVQWFPVVREYGEPSQSVEGDAFVIRTVDPATLPAPVPAIISDRQFAHALKGLGIITHAEAMAFVQTGAIPPALQAVVDALPESEREDAELILAGATVLERRHPMTELLRAAMNWTSDQTDQLWRDGAVL